jgi:hypothetical protein
VPSEDKFIWSAELFEKAAFQATYVNPFYYYLDNISEFLNDEVQNIQNNIEALEKRVDSDEIENKDPHQMPEEIRDNEFWLGQISEFENILFESFFVTIYGFLESQLMKSCREFEQKNKNLKPSLLDWRNRYRSFSKIEQAIKYLIEVQQVDLPLKKYKTERKKIDYYGPLRNCIVHNEGRVDEGLNKKQRNKLNEFIRWKDSKLQFYDPYVVLNKEFCEESLSTIWDFLWAILSVRVQAGQA